MQNPAGPEREQQLVNYHHLMKFLLAPEECFHLRMEIYFEHDTFVIGKSRCERYFSFCTGAHKFFGETFCKRELIGVLCSACSDGRLPNVVNFFEDI